MNIYARQGDLVIRKLETPIAGELKAVKSVTFAGDSSGHPHTLVGACEYRKDGRTTLVRVKAKRVLTHGKADGHKDVALAKGDYEITPLRERGDGSDRIVED
jgi:hypothetical protein